MAGNELNFMNLGQKKKKKKVNQIGKSAPTSILKKKRLLFSLKDLSENGVFDSKNSPRPFVARFN